MSAHLLGAKAQQPSLYALEGGAPMGGPLL